MEIKHHVYVRYCERFLNMKDEKEIKRFIFQNKEDLTNKILDLKNQSKLIWTGVIADQRCRNFYLYDNVCMIVPLNEDVLVTMYTLDYGFCNGKVNKEIIKTLLNELNKAENKINKYKDRIEKILPQKENKLLLINEEIKALEAQLEILKGKKSHFEQDIKLVQDELNYLNLDRDKVAKQLVSSINFKMEMLEEKNGGSK